MINTPIKHVRSEMRRGFTFMEILATMVLIGLILPVAMKGISIATALASDSIRRQEALGLAENRLAEALLKEEWKSGSQSGSFDQDFEGHTWTLETTDWTEPGLKQVDLTVSWEHRGHPKQIRLTTLVYNAE
ncbi:MAG: type II secretion system protein GspI [Planctomycetales bacterium]|nr:type II secretion system protein GspI [Planctomycetales bacterium]